MYNSNFEIEYNSNIILIVSNPSEEEFWVIYLDSENPKIKNINAWLVGVANENIEQAIIEVLGNSGYDTDYELELYRDSDMYRRIKEYEGE